MAFTADQRLELATLAFAYECQVPCMSCRGLEAMREAVGEMGTSTRPVFQPFSLPTDPFLMVFEGF